MYNDKDMDTVSTTEPNSQTSIADDSDGDDPLHERVTIQGVS